MKVLITGGAGFHGSHLTEFLVGQGHSVTILNTYNPELSKNIAHLKDKITVVYGSITDKIVVDKTVHGHDVVFHLAAYINVDQSLESPKDFLEVNVLGTYNVLEAVRREGIRMIHASTCEVYGDGHDLQEGELLSESAEMRPNSPYAASKAGADRLCYSYYKSFGVDVTIVRPFNIFGERQKSGQFGALIPIVVHKALQGEELTIFGDGDATRDYLHVNDLVRAYDLVLQSKNLSGKAINFASGVDTSVKDIVEYVAKKLDAEVGHSADRPGEVMRFPSDMSFAKSLGFEAKYDIWEGIDQYIAWAKQQ
jgi:dTDP-glucose 4,6-dehydratase